MSMLLCLTSVQQLLQVAPKSTSGTLGLGTLLNAPVGLRGFIWGHPPRHHVSLGQIRNRVSQSQSDSSKQEARSATTSGKYLVKPQKQMKSWNRNERKEARRRDEENSFRDVRSAANLFSVSNP